MLRHNSPPPLVTAAVGAQEGVNGSIGEALEFGGGGGAGFASERRIRTAAGRSHIAPHPGRHGVLTLHNPTRSVAPEDCSIWT